MRNLKCSKCGEPLQVEGDHYVCLYCGSVYVEDRTAEEYEVLSSLLEGEKIEQLANARRMLYDAVHAKYPKQSTVVSAAERVLAIYQDEPLAGVYLHSYDDDPYELIQILSNADFNEPQAEECYRWLLPNINYRLVGPVKEFVDRYFKDAAKTKRLTEVEDEAEKIEEGIYVPGLPREVFLAYSSGDMDQVIEVVDAFEENGMHVFAAFRNMRHGKGAADDYLPILKEAMTACSVFVFLSSNNSRKMICDAMSVELPYLIANLPKKKRVEYLINDYSDRTPLLVRDTLKKAFPEQEQCRDLDDLIRRVKKLLTEKEQEPAVVQAPIKQTKLPVEDTDIPEGFVRYGEYPQSKVKDENLAKEIIRSGTSLPNGYVEYQGKQYAIDDEDVFIVEPVLWRLLGKRGEYALAISDVVLDARAFDQDSNVYEESSIRNYLNNEFLHKLFPDGGKRLHKDSETGDFVFFLAEEEMQNPAYGFSNDNNRLAKNTPYSKNMGCFDWGKNGYVSYWTRTPAVDTEDNKYVRIVTEDGGFTIVSCYNRLSGGLRPCIILDVAVENQKVKKSNQEESVKHHGFKIEGDTVYYGEFPQSEVLDERLARIIRSEGKEQENYLIAYDGRLYATSFDKRVFLVEPIKWKVLEKRGKTVLLISEKALAPYPFDSRGVPYEQSVIKRYLNEDFANLAFPDGGSRLVMRKETDEKISLPSIEELNTYLGAGNLKTTMSKYAMVEGGAAENSNDNRAAYWTRNSDYVSQYASVIHEDGTPLPENKKYRCFTVRPIIEIDIS